MSAAATNRSTRAGALPPADTATMRRSAARALPPEGEEPPTGEALEQLTGLLRGHMELIVPQVEQAAAKLPRDDVPRYCALACLGEARRKLSSQAGEGEYGAQAHARRLARSLMALCDHYETLTGIVMCLACDQPIRAGDVSQPYDHAGSSGGAASAGRVHARCAAAVRRR